MRETGREGGGGCQCPFPVSLPSLGLGCASSGVWGLVCSRAALPRSVDVQICFSYVAAPSSYSPAVGESSLLARSTDCRTAEEEQGLQLTASLFSLHPAALHYMLDGDTDRRLRGQLPRVTFLNRGPDDLKHQSSGTVWLKQQHDRVCGDTVLQLQVDTDLWSPSDTVITCPFLVASLAHSKLVVSSGLQGAGETLSSHEIVLLLQVARLGS